MIFTKGVHKEGDGVRNEARHGWHKYSRRQELLSNISEIEKNFKQRNPYTLTMMSVKDNRGNYSNSIDVLSVGTKKVIICVKRADCFYFANNFNVSVKLMMPRRFQTTWLVGNPSSLSPPYSGLQKALSTNTNTNTDENTKH